VASSAAIVVIINPISGTGGRPDVARQRVEQAHTLIDRSGLRGEVLVTEYAGHARDLARAAVIQGVPLVAAWGGDGTINEVASQLVFTGATLAILPSGSGNGLARELKIPFDGAGAFDVAFNGRDRIIDAGELDGHLFFNVAGIGLDARVAHRFAVDGLLRRGLRRYMEITASEMCAFRPDEHTVIADGEALRQRTLLIAIANARQYGNGVLIAPQARVDDGRLDLVMVRHRSLFTAMLQMPWLFAGQIGRLPGVSVRTATDIEVTSAHPVVYHVDGEPFVGGASLRARVRPGALRVRVPG
jgi:diacylglycerol kinase (ATP)